MSGYLCHCAFWGELVGGWASLVWTDPAVSPLRRLQKTELAKKGLSGKENFMELFAFFSYTFVMAFTPGPNNLMAMSESRRAGFRGAAPFLWGLFVSFFILNGVIYGCIHSLQSVLPLIEIPLKAVGSAYILFLTYKMFASSAGGSGNAVDKGKRFLAGMLLNFTNVKVMIFMLIGYTSFILPNYASEAAVVALGVAMCLACAASNVVWALAGAALDRFFKQYDRQVNWILAALLVFSVAEIWL